MVQEPPDGRGGNNNETIRKMRSIDNEACRSLLCGIIEQSINDSKSRAKIARDEARAFLNSPTFSVICHAMKLPEDKLREAAYDTRNNKSKKRKRGQALQGVRLQQVQGELRPDLQEKGYEQ